MTQLDSTWQNKASVRKGNFAENIVRAYLQDCGYIVYEPVTDGAHGFDKLAVKDKRHFIIAECKAKAKRTKYDDTGIDIRHHEEYKRAMRKHHIPVFIFFVDEWLAEIYGNFLSELEEDDPPYPMKQNGIIYFPMRAMKRNIAKLTPEQVEFLKQNSRRNYEYPSA